MEKKVEDLERMFEKAESDINNLSLKLKYDFDNNEDMEVNPVRLLDKLTNVKKEFASVVKETQALQEAEQEAVAEFKGHLGNLFLLVQKLQTADFDATGEKPEELKQLEALTGMSVPWSSECEPTVPETASTSDISPVQSSPSEDQNNTASSDDTSETQVPATINRDTSPEFVEITEAEFESVSSLIRGRVKLAEVNTTFKTLWEDFASNKDSRPYTSEDMRKMGLRVSGATGQAKLKVLRALKILKITPKGDVVILLKKPAVLVEKLL